MILIRFQMGFMARTTCSSVTSRCRPHTQMNGNFDVLSRVVSIGKRLRLDAGVECGPVGGSVSAEWEVTWRRWMSPVLQASRVASGGTSWEKPLPCYGSSGGHQLRDSLLPYTSDCFCNRPMIDTVVRSLASSVGSHSRSRYCHVRIFHFHAGVRCVAYKRLYLRRSVGTLKGMWAVGVSWFGVIQCRAPDLFNGNVKMRPI